ncbi:Fc.00g072590.m01.CDS01 [Cosmosporella sp. VM-42]
MFAGTAFVNFDLLQREGFRSRKEARRSYFRRVRLLHDFDYERDHITLIQSLLLMTYWHEDLDDEKGPSHWIGLAISLAYKTGIQDNPGPARTSGQRLQRRIWWSCYMRDCLVSLGFRQPLWIVADDFDVPMLVEDDFEIRALPSEDRRTYAKIFFLRSERFQAQLAVMCMSKARLCVCIHRILETQYSIQGPHSKLSVNTTSSMMLLHPVRNAKTDDIHDIGRELEMWADSLPVGCHQQMLSLSDIEDGMSTIAIHRIVLFMVYYGTIIALYRPVSQSSDTQTTTLPFQEQDAREKVFNAAIQIAEMTHDVNQLQLTKYLPATCITMILPAMIVHLLKMKHPEPLARQLAGRGLFRCMHALDQLRQIYNAADEATQILQEASNRAAVDINTGEELIAPHQLTQHGQ